MCVCPCACACVCRTLIFNLEIKFYSFAEVEVSVLTCLAWMPVFTTSSSSHSLYLARRKPSSMLFPALQESLTLPEKNQVSRDPCSHLYSTSEGLVVQPLPDGKIVQWVSVHQSTLPTYECLLLLVSRWEGLSNNISLWNVNMGNTTKGNIVEFFRRGQCLTFRGILQFAFAVAK